jgi:hypothetical protein
MTTTTPDEGREWITEKVLNVSGTTDQKIYDVGVGSGIGSAGPGDTQLDTQEHRANNDDSIVDIRDTSVDGEIECKITVSGGTEVPGGTSITELGVWARDPSLPQSDFRNGSQTTNDSDDVMVYHEQRAGVTIPDGDRKTFAFKINIENP